ncbi:MAG: hypothetical protein ACYDAJ_04055 [Nitrosotalea sp.]
MIIGISLVFLGTIIVLTDLASPPYLYHTSSCSPSGNCVSLDADWYPISHYVVFSIIGASILSGGITIIVFSKRWFKNGSRQEKLL